MLHIFEVLELSNVRITHKKEDSFVIIMRFISADSVEIYNQKRTIPRVLGIFLKNSECIFVNKNAANEMLQKKYE